MFVSDYTFRNGGDGGDAGKGGNAGNGGNIQICSTDPTTFIFTEVDVSNGIPGKSGLPGNGGQRGYTSQGGAAGKGGVRLVTQNNGVTYQERAADGVVGKNGEAGRDGETGRENDPGQHAKPGSISYVWQDALGNIIESGVKRYHLRVVSYRVRETLPDAVFEPGDLVHIDEIRVINDGDMTLPSGSLLHVFAQDHTSYKLQFIGNYNQNISLPTLAVGQVFEVPASLQARIVGPQDYIRHAPLQSEIILQTKVELLNREFSHSALSTRIPVQFPLQIEKVEVPQQLGNGVDCQIFIHVKNVSSVPFGCQYSNDKQNYDATLILQVHKDHDFHFVDTESSYVEIPIDMIPAKETIVLTQKALMGYETGFFESVSFELDLQLRNTIIQSQTHSIKCVPLFNASTANESDVLLFTNIHFSKEEFHAYNSIFKLLRLKPSYWDVDYYNGISIDTTTHQPHYPTWKSSDLFHNKLLLFPLYHFGGQEKKVFELLHDIDIINHFSSTHESQAGLVLLTNNPKQFDKTYMKQYFKKEAKLEKELSRDGFSDAFRVSSPSVETMQQKCLALEKECETNNPTHAYLVEGTFAPEKLSTSLWKMAWIYSYGSAQVLKMPISLLDRFFIIDFEQKHRLPLMKNGMDIKMDSTFFKLLFGILCSLSLHKKMEILSDGMLTEMEFGNCTGSISLESVIQSCVYEDVLREFLRENDPLFAITRLDVLRKEVLENKRFLTPDMIFVVLLVMARLEYRMYKRSFVPELLGSYVQSFKQKYAAVEVLKKSFIEAVKKNATLMRNMDLESLIVKSEEEAKKWAAYDQPKARLLLRQAFDA